MKKGFLSQLKQGMKVEMEHKDVTLGDLVMTRKIAAAHLREDPAYYTKLKKAGLNPAYLPNLIDGFAKAGDKINVSWERWIGDGEVKQIASNGDMLVHVISDIGKTGKWNRTGKTIIVPQPVGRRLASLTENPLKHQGEDFDKAYRELAEREGYPLNIAENNLLFQVFYPKEIQELKKKFNIKRNPTKGNFAWVLLGLGIIAVLTIPMFRNAEGSLTLIEYLRRGR